MAKRIGKLKTGSEEWIKHLWMTVIGECPPLIECKKCGHPILQGFVCWWCGEDSPGSNKIDVGDWL